MSSDQARAEAVTQAADHKRAVQRLALRMAEAARAMGISVDSFERHVEPQIKIVRLGRVKLAPVAELDRFIAENGYQIGGDW